MRKQSLVSLLTAALGLLGCTQPSITSISPSSGPTTGGTAIAIIGTNFTDVRSVTVGGTGINGLTVESNTAISGTTPGGPSGPQDVVVVTGAGTAVLPGGFVYSGPPPSVGSISPSSGPTSGGTSITITGTGFAGVQSVTIGGRSLASFTVASATSITGTVPAGVPGPRDVVVITSAHGSGTLAGGFTYTAVSPRQLGTAGSDGASGVAMDASGNIFVAGSTTGSFPMFSNSGGYDVFVMKLDGGGALQWVRQIGTTTDEFVGGVATDKSGNVYAVGRTKGGLYGEDNEGYDDAFVIKYNGNGALLWVRQIGTSDADYAHAVTVDGWGNVLVAGQTAGGLWGANQGIFDAFVAKYDGNGQLAWVEQIGTAEIDEAHAVAVDGSNNVFVGGWTHGSLSGFTSAGNSDPFVVKFNSSAVHQWTRQFGTGGYDELHGIAVDGSGGDILVTGRTTGSFPGFTNGGSDDGFLAKLDGTGAQRLLQQFGTAGSEYARGVALDEGGNPFIAGSTTDAFPGFATMGSYDSYVARYNGSGERQWIKQAGTFGADYTQGVVLDGSGDVFAIGETTGSFPGFTSAGVFDLYMMKYGSDGTVL